MFIDYLISFILALIMFTIGSTLKPGNFVYLAKNPKLVTIGLLLQMLFLPVLAFILVSWFPMRDEFKVGIMVLALCPGGTTANLVSFLVNAEVALSIALTSINSFLILATIPLFTYLTLIFFTGHGDIIHLPVGDTIINILVIILLPVALGMLFNRFFPTASLFIKNPLKYLTIVMLAVMFLIKFFAPNSQGGSGITGRDILILLPVTLLIHVLSVILSYYLSRLSITSIRSCTTIAIEVGLQNTTLALLITSTLLKNEEMAKPALVYALFSFFTTFGFAWWVMKRNRKRIEQYESQTHPSERPDR